MHENREGKDRTTDQFLIKPRLTEAAMLLFGSGAGKALRR
jgi:hypothetical protein